LQEHITYEIIDEKMILTGETFHSELALKTTHKILETSKFFLIYASKQVANIIPKKDMDANEVIQLRNILSKLDSVKNKKLK
jgi:hypothetical protein